MLPTAAAAGRRMPLPELLQLLLQLLQLLPSLTQEIHI